MMIKKYSMLNPMATPNGEKISRLFIFQLIANPSALCHPATILNAAKA